MNKQADDATNPPATAAEITSTGPSGAASDNHAKPTKSTKPTKIWVLSRVNDGVLVIFKWLSVSCCATMFVVISLQVILRYGFNTGLPWAEELARITMISLAFLSVPAAYRYALNVRIDILPHLLPPRLRILLNIVTHGGVAVFAWYFLKYSYAFTIAGKNIYSTSIPFLTMNYIYMLMPISFTMLILVIIEQFLSDVKSLIAPTAPSS